LREGAQVEARGVRRPDGALLLTRVRLRSDNSGPGNQEQRVEGAVANLAGACPARSFSVAGRAVSTSATTRFDDTSCAALVTGMRVEVRGLLNGNGTLDAFRVSRKD
jgi:hypothetical protein